MRALIIAGLLLATASAGADRAYKFGMGIGLETRLQREINPGFTDVRAAGQVFQMFRLHPWTAAVEAGYERQESGSGGFKVTSSSLAAGVWGRYGFAEPERWAPFVSTGVGAYFDRVNSSFAGESDTRRGVRRFWGAGLGINKIFGEYFLLETELRASFVQDRRDPMLALIVRTGVQL